MLKMVILFLCLLLGVMCNAQTEVIANSTFRVGVILDSDSLIGRIGLNSLALALSDFYSVNTNYATRLVLHVSDSREQVVDSAAAGIYLLSPSLSLSLFLSVNLLITLHGCSSQLTK